MWITLDQIEYLQEVSESGSVTKAADKLLRSKSAVTKAIQNLEDQVGFPILDRSDYRAKLTPNGKSFLFRAQDVLKAVAELKEACSQISSKVETKLSLSISGAYDSKKLYPVIKEASRLFPNTQIQLFRETLSGEKMLFEEMVDLAIFEGIYNQRDLDFKALGKIDFKLVMAADHDFLKRPKDQRSLKDLYKYPQIIQSSTLAKDSVSYGVHKESAKWYVTDILSKKEVIMNGLGWGRLPLHEIASELKSGKLVHLKEFKDDDSAQAYIAKRKNFPLGKVAHFIWENL
jgi:DNA-binding transcriptional LysR family regulator